MNNIIDFEAYKLRKEIIEAVERGEPMVIITSDDYEITIEPDTDNEQPRSHP